MMGRAAVVATVVVGTVATALAGCAATPPASAPPPAATSGSVLGTAPAATTTPGTTATPILPDGRSPVLITAIDVPGHTITFDLVELYLGLDAAKEWKKDHPGATVVPPLDGHYMRNNNPKLRTLPVATDVVVTLAENDPDHPMTIPYSSLPGADGLTNPFWLTVSHGVVTKIEQQFIP